MSNHTTISAERVIDHSAADLFEVLSNPERHSQIDGSGMVRGHHKSNRIAHVGDVFTMEMHAEQMGGDYRTDNHVTGYIHDKLIAWQTAPEGREPAGWEWMWELEPKGAESTLVRLTYDWSKVTDKDVLKRVSFPVVSERQLEESLAKLATAAAGPHH